MPYTSTSCGRLPWWKPGPPDPGTPRLGPPSPGPPFQARRALIRWAVGGGVIHFTRQVTERPELRVALQLDAVQRVDGQARRLHQGQAHQQGQLGACR
jgi:hypothetical protein